MLSRLPGRTPRVAPGGCFFSSVALSAAPCQGSSGPFGLSSCPLLLHLRGATRALALPGSFAHCRFGAGASSALPLAAFPEVFLLVQNSLCLAGLQACCTMRSCRFSALPACDPSAGQAGERFSCLPGQEAQGSKFCKAKGVLVIDPCPTWENSPGHHTPLLLLLFGVWSVPILLLQVLLHC